MIAIISLLVSMLMPSLQRVRDIAKKVICAGNIRHVGLGLACYVVDSGGFYPEDKAVGGWAVADRYPRWWPTIGPYVGDDWGAWDGTNWPKKAPVSNSGEGTLGRCPNHTEQPRSYSVRANQNLIRWPGSPSLPVDNIALPSDRLVVFECHTECRIPLGSGIWYGGWLKWPFGASGNPSVNTHDTVSNFLMADSHVETVHYSQMQSNYAWYFGS